VLLAESLFAAPPATRPAIQENDVLSTLHKPHPRLMLHDDGLERLKTALKDGSDKDLARCVEQVLQQADKTATEPMLERKLIGPRLLSVSRESVRRIYTLGMAWRLTGKEVYARSARANLLAVCEFEDWNPSHFLDVAEMSHAVGVGYDWFYSYLAPADRDKIRKALVRLGLQEGLAVYEKGKGWFHTSTHNWNQVCNGGLLAGALAVADEEPGVAARIVTNAVKSLPRALATYDPDGAWGEGPSYWSYATHYTAYGLGALNSALGNDFGLSKSDGLRLAGHFPIHTAGPKGLMLNFADVNDLSKLKSSPCTFWLARTYNDATLAATEHQRLESQTSTAQHLVWWVKRPADAAKLLASRPLEAYFRGAVEVVTFRSGWDAGATFAGIKAGYNQVNHGHLDLGNFELDIDGVRWARDLGSDDYNLPSYWQGQTQDGKRWTYYRLSSLSHNVPLLAAPGGALLNQNCQAKSRVTLFSKENSRAVVDLSQAYAPRASKAFRGLAMVDDRRAVLVQDELELAQASDVTWAMTTDAAITTGGASASLKQDGKELTATILSPAGAVFSVESAQQQKPQKENKGVSRLLVKLPNQAGAVRLVVLLASHGRQVKAPQLVPLEKW
jgi:hypothetical protein